MEGLGDSGVPQLMWGREDPDQPFSEEELSKETKVWHYVSGIGKGLQLHPEAQGHMETGTCLPCSDCQGDTEGRFLLPRPLVPLQYIPELTAELAARTNRTVLLQKWSW